MSKSEGALTISRCGRVGCTNPAHRVVHWEGTRSGAHTPVCQTHYPDVLAAADALGCTRPPRTTWTDEGHRWLVKRYPRIAREGMA